MRAARPLRMAVDGDPSPVTDEYHELRAVLREVSGRAVVCGGTLNP